MVDFGYGKEFLKVNSLPGYEKLCSTRPLQISLKSCPSPFLTSSQVFFFPKKSAANFHYLRHLKETVECKKRLWGAISALNLDHLLSWCSFTSLETLQLEPLFCEPHFSCTLKFCSAFAF